MTMPYVWRGIDGTYIDSAAGLALDWDTAWSDAVHSHLTDPEGGLLTGPAIASGHINIGSDTVTAAEIIGTQSGGSLTANGAAGTLRLARFRTAGSTRWQIGANATAESGANAGSDFTIRAFTDAEGALGQYLGIARATGVVTLAAGLTVTTGTVDLTGATVSIDDLTNITHTHANAANGGQLDWDTCWSDAVHSHQSNAEGGALDAAAITGSVTGSGNIVKATGPTVTTLTVSSGTTTLQAVNAAGKIAISAGGLDVAGSPTGFSGGEVRYSSTGAGQDFGITTIGTGTPVLYFNHRAASNTGTFVWANGTDGGTTRMSLGGTGNLNVTGDVTIGAAIDHNGSTAGFFGTAPTTKPTVTGSRGGNAALASLLTGLAGLGLLTDSSTT